MATVWPSIWMGKDERQQDRRDLLSWEFLRDISRLEEVGTERWADLGNLGWNTYWDQITPLRGEDCPMSPQNTWLNINWGPFKALSRRSSTWNSIFHIVVWWSRLTQVSPPVIIESREPMLTAPPATAEGEERSFLCGYGHCHHQRWRKEMLGAPDHSAPSGEYKADQVSHHTNA